MRVSELLWPTEDESESSAEIGSPRSAPAFEWLTSSRPVQGLMKVVGAGRRFPPVFVPSTVVDWPSRKHDNSTEAKRKMREAVIDSARPKHPWVHLEPRSVMRVREGCRREVDWIAG